MVARKRYIEHIYTESCVKHGLLKEELSQKGVAQERYHCGRMVGSSKQVKPIHMVYQLVLNECCLLETTFTNYRILARIRAERFQPD